MKCLAIVHCYHPDLWPELAAALRAAASTCQLDVYVTGSDLWTTYGSFPHGELLGNYQEYPNRGLDVGPFLRTCQALGESLYGYDYLLKLHGKKSEKTHPRGHRDGTVWRRSLIDPLCARASHALSVLGEPGIGMVGAAPWVCPKGDGNNWSQVSRYRTLGDVFPTGNTPEHWVAGTMFWCKPVIFKPLFARLSPEFLANELEPGYFTDWETGKNTHALERAFGYLTATSGLRVAGL